MATPLPRARRYAPPPADLFVRNRRKFTAQLAPGTAAVLFANELLPSNADAHYGFTQNRNYYYLTGLDQENGWLWLCPDAPKASLREVLFIPRHDPTVALWEGWKYSADEAIAASGVSNVRYTDEWEGFLRNVLSHVSGFALDFNEHDRNALYVATPAHRLAERLGREYPGHEILRANPILGELRMRKEPEEVTQIREAIRITASAFERVRQFVRPGVTEFEIEAEILHEFKRQGAGGEAYGSIIASGKNACVLHYVINNATCQDGDVLLMDFGAEFGNYAADLTRCLPVGGRFTERQLAIYEAVRRVKDAVTAIMRPGTAIQQLLATAGECMTTELLALGLITPQEVDAQTADKPAHKTYFPHGIGHSLGLDVHDVGSRYGTLAPGMVFTVEPGIYIPAEGIGIRLEDNILVTSTGPENLMGSIPILPVDIQR
jgi:Xaa-Pro aminopeptidase